MKYREDQRDLDQFLAGNEKVCYRIYFKFKEDLNSYLVNNYKNYVHYCEDLVLETFTIILEMDKTPELICELKTYLISIADKQLNKKISKDKNLVFDDRKVFEKSIADSIFEEVERNEKRRITDKAFQRLNSRCRRIIEAFCRSINCVEAAKRMKYKSNRVFLTKKSECMRELTNFLNRDPRYLELINEKNRNNDPSN